MRQFIVRAGSTGMLLSLLAAGGAAQELEQRHRGFWFGLGFGGGWNQFDWTFGNSGRGGASYIRAGGTVNQHVLVGGEALVWFRDGGDDRSVERVNASLTAMVYPGSRGGLFFKGGFGAASHDIDSDTRRDGIGLTTGMGFDFKIARNLYLTPNVDVLTQFLRDDTSTALLFTVGLGWH